MKNELAIVIPAYKSIFLERTLTSIANQNNKNFKLYIGDDNSPHNLSHIINKYRNSIDIVYYKFEDNLGSKDLPGHWDRCIGLTSEPLIWLFSDDDIMPIDGVTRILEKYRNYKNDCLIMRFPLNIIDGNDVIIHKNPILSPLEISSYNFLIDKLSGKISSAACEYVFTRKVWELNRGFVKFPLAWCSDDATWTSFATLSNGIIPLNGAAVSWRNANGENICNSSDFDKEKINATCMFIIWITKHFASKTNDSILAKAVKIYINTILRQSVRGNFSFIDLCKICHSVSKISYKSSISLFNKYIYKIKLK